MAVQLRDDGIVWREVQGEIVILSLAGSEYFRLNATGGVLWMLMANSEVEEAALPGVLVDQYGIDMDHAVDVVASFLDVLESKGLVTR